MLRQPSRFFRLSAVTLLCCFAASLQAANTRMTAIALFDGSDGPAYVQISGVTLNGKTELRMCDGVTKIEKRNYDLLFKWFLDLPIDAKAFDATTFSKNRRRLLDHEIRTSSSSRWSPR